MITSLSFAGGAQLTILPTGPGGPTGPVPDHAWTGTSVKFKKPDGSWGNSVDLKGAKGDKGDTGARTELRYNDGVLQWRLAAQTPADAWKNLIDLGDYVDAAAASQAAAAASASAASASAGAAATSVVQAQAWRDAAASLTNTSAAKASAADAAATRAEGAAQALESVVSAYKPDAIDKVFATPTKSIEFLDGFMPRDMVFSRASAGTCFGPDGALRLIDVNEMRHDYDPITGAYRGALIEPGATNLIKYNGDFSQAWNMVNLAAFETVTKNGIVFRKVAAASTAPTLFVQHVASAGNASGNTMSVLAMKGSGHPIAQIFLLRNATTATVLVQINVDLDAGTFTYSGGLPGGRMTKVVDGVWLIELTAATGINSGDTLSCYCCFGGAVAAAGVHTWVAMPQLEAGLVATSRIATASTAVTRAPDVASMPVGDWYRQDEGTVLIEARAPAVAPSGTRALMDLGDGATNGRHRLIMSGLVPSYTVTVAGVIVAALDAAAVPAGADFRVAASWRSGRLALSVNGAAPIVSTAYAGAMPAATTLVPGSLVRRPLAYWPRVLSDADLQTLSRL